MRGFWAVAVVLSGCSLFEPLDITYESKVADSGVDAGLDLADASVADVTLSDASMDARPDASDMPLGCLSELPRTEFTYGLACDEVPQQTQVGDCDAVVQSGCAEAEFCDLVPFQLTVKPTCRDALNDTLESCEFVPYDEVCAQRESLEDPNIEKLGICYPGSICRGLKTTQTTSPCSRYCTLNTARGCKSTEYCVPITTDYSVFGIGRCATDNSDCSVP